MKREGDRVVGTKPPAIAFTPLAGPSISTVGRAMTMVSRITFWESRATLAKSMRREIAYPLESLGVSLV
ncbi:hypothetical protein JQ554_08445 [Bradyrhizobium diazoefficiens]|nr:hypothetical protein [Bradyrhizobium diazoefficiens]MBN8991414.1 hypothetical protein [Hyphomicrobiales bacterium]UCF53420.1 MAG: hypothetical protein JSV48_02780 [Bradyrhizobium sp.]MBR0964098.1 hypothetical protein [Bradyrhizobium diazoefficiens]MBR0978258.1 hypothetical protein [Bradyrhizobium diazoefficiens]MBR1006189.1 hypothetical protein [Bradyrhizobium diazoefficiens]